MAPALRGIQQAAGLMAPKSVTSFSPDSDLWESMDKILLESDEIVNGGISWRRRDGPMEMYGWGRKCCGACGAVGIGGLVTVTGSGT